MQYSSAIHFARVPLSAALAAFLLASCGGSGSSPAPSPAPAPSNSAPQFSSAGSVSFAENSTGAFYTAAATDADGDTVSFSIAGGPDASAFTISGGQLTFASVPDFEMPVDSGRDNVYNVTLSAQDGRGGSASLDLVVSVTNDKEGIAVRRIASLGGEGKALGATDNGEIVAYLGDGRYLRVDGQSGAVNSSGQMFSTANTKLMTAFNAFLGAGVIQGHYAIGQLPSGELLASFVRAGQTAITKETVFTPSIAATPNASIVQIDDNNNFHVAVGVSQDSDAQDANSAFGKLYQLQADPYCGASTLSFCLGLSVIGDGVRQPGGAGKIGDEILFADQGASVEHELNFYPANARPIDFGWPNREGTQAIVANAPAAVNGPTLAYDYGSDPFEGEGIVIGGIYGGTVADLADRYIFGDANGSIFAIPLSTLTNGFLHRAIVFELRTADFEPDVGAIDSPVGFASDGNGFFYILDSDGELFRVEAG